LERPCLTGLISSDKPFLRTPKCENQRAVIKGVLMAWEEMLIFLTFCLSSAAIISRHGTDNPEILLWVGVMLIQSLPYGAALLTSMINVIPALVPRAIFQQILCPARRACGFLPIALKRMNVGKGGEADIGLFTKPSNFILTE